jgi:competence protein CoiA
MWHRRWKSVVVPECREVVIGGSSHRADIHVANGLVIELQHSPISPAEIRERERFYGAMVWVFDVESAADHFSFRVQDGYVSFRWKWPRRHIAAATAPVYLDLGFTELFHLRKMHDAVPCGGWGRWIHPYRFYREVVGVASLSAEVLALPAFRGSR